MAYLDEAGNTIGGDIQNANPYSALDPMTGKPYGSLTYNYHPVTNGGGQPAERNETPTPPKLPTTPTVPTPPVTPLPNPGMPGYKGPTIGGQIPVATPTKPTPPTTPKIEPGQPTTPPPTMGTPTPTKPGEPTLGAPPAPPDPNAKPPGTEDPAVAAAWYQKFIPSITTADVIAYRTHPGNYKDITEWFNAGNRAENQDWDKRFGPNGTEVNGTPQPGLGMPVDDAAARYFRRQWYLENIATKNLDPNDPNNFVGGVIFDQYGNYVTPKSATPTPPGGGGGGGDTPPNPDGTPPITPPHVDPAPPVIPAGGGSGGGTGTTPDPNGGDYLQQLMQMQRKLYQPQFDWEQQQLARQAAASGALSGDLNSGGFSESLGRAQALLGANQGERLSSALGTASENALNRAVQYKQIDSNQVIATMQNETQRLGITTNDQLQRWLDSQDNVLKKYGIDTNDVLQRYQAQLQLQGQSLQAQAGVNAAALQAAATASAAAANAKTQLALAQLGQQTQLGLGQQQYDLGVLGINAQNYRSDQQTYLQYLQMLMSLSPEMRTQLPTLPVPYGH